MQRSSHPLFIILLVPCLSLFMSVVPQPALQKKAAISHTVWERPIPILDILPDLTISVLKVCEAAAERYRRAEHILFILGHTP